MNKAVFLDRDGTINEDMAYLYKPEDFRWIAGAKEAIKYARDKGYLVIIVTNQSGVARGYFTEDDVKALHNFINDELQKINTKIDAFYYCPHHPKSNIPKYKAECNCRKPKSGMILQAAKDFDIDLSASFIFGDKERDILAGYGAGVKGEIFDPKGNLFALVSKYI
ncbi:MAG: HAD family hydrolase [Selenomonadaceae bacterium]|nr:HAD family hydrolase [Selenomonadaceae bacterium]